jgi:hypothetical protein
LKELVDLLLRLPDFDDPDLAVDLNAVCTMQPGGAGLPTASLTASYASRDGADAISTTAIPVLPSVET